VADNANATAKIETKVSATLSSSTEKNIDIMQITQISYKNWGNLKKAEFVYLYLILNSNVSQFRLYNKLHFFSVHPQQLAQI